MANPHKLFLRDLGLHIKRQRMTRNFTIERMAARAGLSKSMISQVENGHNSLSLNSLIILAKLLRLDMNEILKNKFPRRCPLCRGIGTIRQ